MKIRFISHKPYPEFEVYEENKRLIHIKIDPEIQAFRITALDVRRVFFIADEIVKKNKITTLLNEYSQQLGSLIKSKSSDHEGEIEIEGVSYNYTQRDDLKEINLFEQNNYRPFITCQLETGQFSFLNQDYVSYLLFSLAWYKFLTKKQPASVQFAEA